jgi:hypothetical protein
MVTGMKFGVTEMEIPDTENSTVNEVPVPLEEAMVTSASKLLGLRVVAYAVIIRVIFWPGAMVPLVVQPLELNRGPGLDCPNNAALGGATQTVSQGALATEMSNRAAVPPVLVRVAVETTGTLSRGGEKGKKLPFVSGVTLRTAGAVIVKLTGNEVDEPSAPAIVTVAAGGELVRLTAVTLTWRTTL